MLMMAVTVLTTVIVVLVTEAMASLLPAVRAVVVATAEVVRVTVLARAPSLPPVAVAAAVLQVTVESLVKVFLFQLETLLLEDVLQMAEVAAFPFPVALAQVVATTKVGRVRL